MEKLKEYRISPRINKILMEIEKFQGVFENRHELGTESITSLKKHTIVTSSGSSTRIEGAILTDTEVQEFIKKGCKVSKISSRSEREVAGYVEALNYIYNNFSELEITEKNIRELHQILTLQLLEGQLPQKQRGAYKDITNHVVEKDLITGKEIIWFKTTPPGPQTATAMLELIKNFNYSVDSDVHPIVVIAAFISHFLAIHPFRDGNGRLSRLMTVWLMLRFGYHWMQFVSHEKVIEDNKENYYLSLRETQNSFDKKTVKYDRWFEFFVTVLQKQINIMDMLLKKESPLSSMNPNEQKVYEIIETYGDCGIGFILKQVDMTRAGLKTLLKRMVTAGHIKTKGVGRATVYYQSL